MEGPRNLGEAGEPFKWLRPPPTGMDVSKLAGEAFASGRLEILRLLLAEPLRYTDIARRVELSEGEVSRHLQRLHSSGLVLKQATGAFEPTPLAVLTLAFEEGLGFLASHAEYFATHDPSLPPALAARVADLGAGQFLTDPIELHAAVDRVFESVRGRFDGICLIASHMAHEAPVGHLRALRDAAERHGTRFRLVLQEEEALLGVHVHAHVSDRFEYRTVPVSRVDVAIGDGSALVAFANRDGRMDYNQGFVGSDPRFMAFCQDLFEQTWARARPVAPTVLEQAARQPPLPELRALRERPPLARR